MFSLIFFFKKKEVIFEKVGLLDHTQNRFFKKRVYEISWFERNTWNQVLENLFWSV